MTLQFRNRADAGQQLARKLTHYGDRPEVLILALPRGGVPVAYEVAEVLHAPLDIFVVRKLGLPGHEELAMGAIASGGIRVLNGSVVEALGIRDQVIETVAARELQELERRESAYRDNLPRPEVEGRIVILVDDGIATGSTVRAAAEALRQLKVGRIVVATPVVSLATVREMRAEVDEIVAVITPANLAGVGRWYADFTQTTDDEVRGLLEEANQIPTGAMP